MARRLALIIGNSVYRDETLARLATPDVDVGDLADCLLDNEIGNFDDVKLLTNMSFGAVRSAISDFFTGKKRDDLLLLYFSGHGVLDDRGRLYLAVKDTNTRLLRDRAISAGFIADEMNNSYSQRQVLILDCCHSGAFARGTKGQTGARVGTASAFEGTGYGRVVLTASDATQYAWEGDQVIGNAQNSLFTHFLVRGLKSGEADINKDGRITVDELFDYVYENVVRQTPKQMPGKWSYKERGEIILALHPIESPEAEIAPPSSVSEPGLPKDSERNLEKLYLHGLTAYHLEEWENAVQSFKAIVEIQTDYQDVTDKLAEAERQVKLAALYKRLEASREENDWQSALSASEELIALEPGYKDVAIKMEGLRTQKRLFDLYGEAQQLFMAEQWKAVISIFSKIEAIQPDYPDADGLKAIARQKVEALERQELVADLYARSLFEIEAGQWGEARRLLTQIKGLQPGYEATDKLLNKVEAAISEQAAEAEKARQAAIKQVEPAEDQLIDTLREAEGVQPAAPVVGRESLITAGPELSEGLGTSRRTARLKEFSLLAPGAILFILLQGYPLLSTFWISLHNYYSRINAPPQFVGLQNYARVFSEAGFGQLLGNSIGLFIVRATAVLIVWLLLRACWQRLHFMPTWLVLAAVAPLPFLFSLGNTVSWLVFGSGSGPLGRSTPFVNPDTGRLFILLIDGLNMFAVSAAAGLLFYALIQRMHPAGSKPGLTALKILRSIMFVVAAISALQAFAPGLINPRTFDVPLKRMYTYQAQMMDFGSGAAIASIVIVALVFCAWWLWRTLKARPLRLVWLPEQGNAGKNGGKVRLLPLLLGVLPGLIILFPYVSLMITSQAKDWSNICASSGSLSNFICTWSWSDWFLNNLLLPGLVIWLVQLPVAFSIGYVLALKRLPGRNANRLLTGLFLFSAILGPGAISGGLSILLRAWNQLGLSRTMFYPLVYSGAGAMLFMVIMNSMAERINRAREAGKSEWGIIRNEILPRVKPLILLFGALSMYWASQRYVWHSLFSALDQRTAGDYLYNTLGYYQFAGAIVPAMVYPFAILCAVAIILLIRKLLERLAIIVDVEDA